MSGRSVDCTYSTKNPSSPFRSVSFLSISRSPVSAGPSLLCSHRKDGELEVKTKEAKRWCSGDEEHSHQAIFL
jgi:hypothetical protein